MENKADGASSMFEETNVLKEFHRFLGYGTELYYVRILVSGKYDRNHYFVCQVGFEDDSETMHIICSAADFCYPSTVSKDNSVLRFINGCLIVDLEDYYGNQITMSIMTLN